MTCIVAYKDDETGKIYMGSDSCGSSPWMKIEIKNKKVFKTIDNTALIGSCGCFSLINILSSVDGIIDKLDIYENNITEQSLTLKTMPMLIKTFKKYDAMYTNSNGRNIIDGIFLLAIKDKLFMFQQNLSIVEIQDKYMTVGSGESFAMGVLNSKEKMSPVDRVLEALRSAAKHGDGVEGPFYIMNTENDEVLKFDK